MRLPHYLFAFVCMSQLIIDTHALITEGESLLWIPDEPSTGRFIEKVASYRQRLSAETSAGSSCLWCKAPIDVNKKLIKYFDAEYIEADNRPELVSQVLSYLLRTPMSPQDLEKWCGALANKFNKQYEGIASVPDSILYAFYTLLLQNHGNEEVTNMINAQITHIKSKLRIPDSLAQWSHELHHPELGFSKNFQLWYGKFETLLKSEPRLKEIHHAMENEHPSVQIIDQKLSLLVAPIFGKQRLLQVSSQTRVATIALFDHLYYKYHATLGEKISKTIKNILEQDIDYYLFDHESKLLKALLKDSILLSSSSSL